MPHGTRQYSVPDHWLVTQPPKCSVLLRVGALAANWHYCFIGCQHSKQELALLIELTPHMQVITSHAAALKASLPGNTTTIYRRLPIGVILKIRWHHLTAQAVDPTVWCQVRV